MEITPEQARESLQSIAKSQSAANRQSANNGVVPLVWAGVVLVSLIMFDITQASHAGFIVGMLSGVTAFWSTFYTRRLRVEPLKIDKPWFFSVWAVYHAAVLMGGIALGTGFWHHHSYPFTFTIIAILDSAPLFWVGFQQRRRYLQNNEVQQ